MTAILIPLTQHGANSQISHGKLKLMKIKLHDFMNCTINHLNNLWYHQPLIQMVDGAVHEIMEHDFQKRELAMRNLTVDSMLG
jgi:hypothetical protein